MPNGDIYAPLSQNMTDSDSEEEIHHTTRRINKDSIMNNIVLNNHTSEFNVHPHIDGDMTEFPPSNNYTNFNSDDEERNDIDSDSAGILVRDNGTKSMSFKRKICFIGSIVLLIVVVVSFIWVIPCSSNHTCPASSEYVSTHNWIRRYERIELIGAINVADGLRGRSRNIVFLYRGDNIFPQRKLEKPNGVISLVGNSGRVAWYEEMVSEPLTMDCGLIDANLDGTTDCLIFDECSELRCLNPISGLPIWRFSQQSTKRRDQLNFPLIVPDLTNDGVNELIIPITTNGTIQNSLALISGANGRMIGQPYKFIECSYLNRLQMNKNYEISFNCIRNMTSIQKKRTLNELYSLFINKSVLNVKTLPSAEQIMQHKFYGRRKEVKNQTNIYPLNDRKLIIENFGDCPDNCTLTVSLTDSNKQIQQLIHQTNMYGMVPAVLSFFNGTPTVAKTTEGKNTNGFIVKFWEWEKSDRQKRETNNEFNVFKSNFVQKPTWEMPTQIRLERDTVTNMSTNNMANIRKRNIRETVLLIIFNTTDTKIENTSQSDIVQFCTYNNGTHEEYCQPDINSQENSILIADLDRDGSQELVTYYSTYMPAEENETNSKWNLVTFVNLLRIESELPKLYTMDSMSSN